MPCARDSVALLAKDAATQIRVLSQCGTGVASTHIVSQAAGGQELPKNTANRRMDPLRTDLQ